MSSMYRKDRDMQSGSAVRRATTWMHAFAASCGLIPAVATFTFAVPSAKNGQIRRLEHPT